MEEVEIYITSNGLGRAAIMKRVDGLLCVYVHWLWSEEDQRALNVADAHARSWLNDKTPPNELYEGAEPNPGLFGAIDEARREVLALPGFQQPPVIILTPSSGLL